jgi:hypothetical protein
MDEGGSTRRFFVDYLRNRRIDKASRYYKGKSGARHELPL